MRISHTTSSLSEQKKDALIIFFHGSTALIPAGHAALKKQVTELVRNDPFKGEAAQVTVLPFAGKKGCKKLIAAGLGSAEHFHNALLEQAAAAAVKSGVTAGLKSFAVASTAKIKGLGEADYQMLVGRGAAWGTYAFNTFKSQSKKAPATALLFCGAVSDGSVLKQAQAQGTSLLTTADLANLPGNEAPPSKIASWARAMAKSNGLTCRVLGKAELEKRGCGGILSVSRGSVQEPKMIILKHAGTLKNVKPIVLVGKTVTFDSGGISLKPGKDMGWMRYDKCGGMAVLTAMQMIARMNVKVPVVGILGAAENMPGANAIRPGDIIRAYKGKTIEILNTDAEGRLILADALGLAGDMKPAAIVDLATLTGACIVALGSAAAALLGNDRKLVDTLIASGAASGERLWQLPLYRDYTDDMKSDFADLSNISKSGGAGTATAAAFLQEFVPPGIPWAHLDIAGTAWLQSAKPHQAPGATLFGARLLAHWIAGLK